LSVKCLQSQSAEFYFRTTIHYHVTRQQRYRYSKALSGFQSAAMKITSGIRCC